MLRKVNKYLPVFFIWLAWMVLTAHQVIPHDHHLSDPFNTKDDHCPASRTEADHHKGFPMHCHAFNDLTSEKVVKFVLASYIQITLFSSGGYTFVSDTGNNFLSFSIPRWNIPESFLLNYHSFRAPPFCS